MPALSTTNQYIDLATIYSVDYTDYDTTTGTKYTDAAGVRAALPGLDIYFDFMAATNANFNDTNIVALYILPAIIIDAIMQTDTGLGSNTAFPDNGMQSRAQLLLPGGGFLCNVPGIYSHGEMIGRGSAQYTDLTDGSDQTWGTCMIIDHDNWLDDLFVRRDCFQSFYEGEEADNGRYAEGVIFRGIRFEGGLLDEDHDNTITSSGINFWAAGSGSAIYDCFARGFNDFGFEFCNTTTPGKMFNCCSFLNNKGGVGMIGGGKLTVYDIEGDDNPAMFYVREGNGVDPASCTLTVHGLKIETGPAPARPNPKGTCVLDAKGWINARFYDVDYAGVFCVPDVLFMVEHTDNSSELTVEGLRIFGRVRTLLHDVTGEEKYLVDGDQYGDKWFSLIKSFKWSRNATSARFTSWPKTAQRISADAHNRLDYLDVDGGGVAIGAFDDDAGTPVYDHGLA